MALTSCSIPITVANLATSLTYSCHPSVCYGTLIVWFYININKINQVNINMIPQFLGLATPLVDDSVKLSLDTLEELGRSQYNEYCT